MQFNSIKINFNGILIPLLNGWVSGNILSLLCFKQQT